MQLLDTIKSNKKYIRKLEDIIIDLVSGKTVCRLILDTGIEEKRATEIVKLFNQLLDKHYHRKG